MESQPKMLNSGLILKTFTHEYLNIRNLNLETYTCTSVTVFSRSYPQYGFNIMNLLGIYGVMVYGRLKSFCCAQDQLLPLTSITSNPWSTRYKIDSLSPSVVC